MIRNGSSMYVVHALVISHAALCFLVTSQSGSCHVFLSRPLPNAILPESL